MIREFQTFSAVVGRRTAFKYAGLGLVAAALSACGADGSPGGGPATTTLTAFAKGRWKVGADGGSGLLTVGDGTWELAQATASSSTRR